MVLACTGALFSTRIPDISVLSAECEDCESFMGSEMGVLHLHFGRMRTKPLSIEFSISLNQASEKPSYTAKPGQRPIVSFNETWVSQSLCTLFSKGLLQDGTV